MDNLINFAIVLFWKLLCFASKRQGVKKTSQPGMQIPSSLVLLYSTVISVAYKNNSVIFLVLTLCEETFL